MYCKHCGKKIPEGSKFCRFCGKSLVGKAAFDSHNEENSTELEYSPNTKTKKSITLNIIEVFLWVSVFIFLLNLIPGEETQEPSLSLYPILLNEVAVFSAIGYLRQWYNNFAIPLVLCALFVFINVFMVFSILDIILFSSAVYGVILKYKTINT